VAHGALHLCLVSGNGEKRGKAGKLEESVEPTSPSIRAAFPRFSAFGFFASREKI